MRWLQFKSYILFWLLSVIIILTGAEFVLRISKNPGEAIHFVRPSEYPGLYWENIPNYSGIFENTRLSINEHGFRDRSYSIDKNRGSYRILNLGNSITFGQGVVIDSVYSKQLEVLLNAEPDTVHYEVINAGVEGYNSFQEYVYFKMKGIKFKPDVVLVGYCLTDPLVITSTKDPFIQNLADSSSVVTPNPDTMAPLKNSTQIEAFSGNKPPILDLIKQYLDLHSMLYQFLHQLVHNLKEDMGIRPPLFQLLDKEATNDGWTRSAEALSQLADLARESNTKIVLVIFPVLYKLDNYPFGLVHEFVRTMAQQSGIAVIDLLPVYRKYQTGTLKISPSDSIHPNVLGHRLAAQTIFTNIRQLFSVP